MVLANAACINVKYYYVQLVQTTNTILVHEMKARMVQLWFEFVPWFLCII